METRILHVTESFASGVMELISNLASRQADAGADVIVLYTPRSDTPSPDLLADIFDSRIKLVQASALGTGRVLKLLRLRFMMRRMLGSGHFDAMHLHSTAAGLVGRMAFGYGAYRNATFYSPHGFSFLRQDVPSVLIKLFVLLEKLAALRGTLILSSKSEMKIATEILPQAKLELMVNGIDISNLPVSIHRKRSKPLVAMVGRITYQKAPWIFADIANHLADLADFVWYGDGEAIDKLNWLSKSEVKIMGWIPLAELRKDLQTCDLILFPSLWEGMPLSLIEAQAIGVPAIASRIVGNQDIVVDGLSGYLCDSQDELLARTKELILNEDLRLRMSHFAQTSIREAFDDQRMGQLSLSIYKAQHKEVN